MLLLVGCVIIGKLLNFVVLYSFISCKMRKTLFVLSVLEIDNKIKCDVRVNVLKNYDKRIYF